MLVIKAGRLPGIDFAIFLPGTGNAVKREERRSELARLFAVYKVENGTRVLLGGLAERRKSRRKESNRCGLVEMAKRKYSESPGEELRLVLKEE